MRLTILALIVAAAAAGCGEPMSTADELHGSISDAVSEDHAYLDAARGALTLPAMSVIVDLHASHMDTIFAAMSDHMSMMDHCSGMPSMMGMRDDMRVELTAHVAVMHQIATLTGARDEVEQHVDAMQGMLDDMHRMVDAMHCP